MPAPVSNRLLNALSLQTRQILERHLVSVALPVRTQLFEPGSEPKYFYFITSGIASVVADMKEGNAVEVGLLGRESLPGSLRLLGGQEGTTRCFMQVGGSGLRMAFKDLVQQYRYNPEIHARILQHVQYDALTLGQLSACNRLHDVDERLARWLLMLSDRLEDDALTITQEFIGEMLGTRRSSVTVSAGTLQKAGLIEYRRGHVHILDRERLESAACQCYPLMRRFQKNLYADPVITA